MRRQTVTDLKGELERLPPLLSRELASCIVTHWRGWGTGSTMLWRTITCQLVLCSTFVMSARGTAAPYAEEVLIKRLLEGYNKGTPPRSVVVQHELSIWQISEVSTEDQRMSLQGWWRHYWKDERLSWSPSDFNNVTAMMVPASQIWLPDTHVYQKTSGADQTLARGIDVKVLASGSCFISFPRTVTFGCKMNLEKFPFDLQTCWFELGSVTADGGWMDLIPRLSQDRFSAADVGYLIPNSEFELVSVTTTARNVVYSCCPDNPYPTILYEFTLQRHASASVASVIVPLIIITSLGILGHLLHPHAGERIGLSVTMLLTTAAIYFVASEMLPNVKTSTFISRLYVYALAINVVSLMLTILVISLHNIASPAKLDLGHLRSLFKELDAEKRGQLNLEQVVQGLRLLEVADADHDAVWAQLDADESGSVDLEEWMRLPQLIMRDDAHETRHNFVINLLVRWGERREIRQQQRQSGAALTVDPNPDASLVLPEQASFTAPERLTEPRLRDDNEDCGTPSTNVQQPAFERVSSVASIGRVASAASKSGSFLKLRGKKGKLYRTEDTSTRIGRKVGAEIDFLAAAALTIIFTVLMIREFSELDWGRGCSHGLIGSSDAISVTTTTYMHLSCTDRSAIIYYTIDGSKPRNLQDFKEAKAATENGKMTFTYSGLIDMNQPNMVDIKAIAVADRSKSMHACMGFDQKRPRASSPENRNPRDDYLYTVKQTIVTMIDERNLQASKASIH